jgi:hypothetical protein
MAAFCAEKNRQDCLKDNNDASYNPGIRETCKAYMNILSGKVNQTYHYDVVNKVIDNMSSLDHVKGNTMVTTLKRFTVVQDPKGSIADVVEKDKKKVYYDYSLIGAQLYCYSREHMFRTCIRPCYELGYKPIIIETDSLVAEKAFFDTYIKTNPTILHPQTSQEIPLFCQHGSLKTFGQIEIELPVINEVITYLKKSYFLAYPGGYKHRFKGVSRKGFLVPPDYMKAFEAISILESTGLPASITDDEDFPRDLAIFREKLHAIAYHLEHDPKYSLSNPLTARELFIDLSKYTQRTVAQTLLKKNLRASNKHESISVSVSICPKTFNADLSSTSKKLNPHQAYKYLQDLTLPNIMPISMVDK